MTMNAATVYPVVAKTIPKWYKHIDSYCRKIIYGTERQNCNENQNELQETLQLLLKPHCEYKKQHREDKKLSTISSW